MSSDRNSRILTLEQFIIEREHEVPEARGSFSNLIRDIALASRIINREVNKAGLVDILGHTGLVNVQGEEVQKLDEFANNVMIDALSRGGEVCAIGSEELDDFLIVDTPQSKGAEYVVMMDPLDGSSNIEVNVSIGTIFSIYKRVSGFGPATMEDCLQPGNKQVAAGYIIYGSSTMFVYTTGFGVNGFTLDPGIGEYFLSHPNIRIPDKCKIYSVNEGNVSKFDQGVKAWLDHVKGLDGMNEKPWSSRYIGSMVADVHRNLLKGGVFLYPATTDGTNGKLRLMFEANPMGFIVEQAGGLASDGKNNILEIIPEALHQRVPVFMGNLDGVENVQTFLKQYDLKKVKS